MSAQLKLHLDSGPEPVRTRLQRGLGSLPRRSARLFVRVSHWAPLWIPGLFAFQIACFGLRPVVAERYRLERTEREVRAREALLLAESELLERERLMLGDPIWRERVQKSSRYLDGKTLELSASLLRARSGS